MPRARRCRCSRSPAPARAADADARPTRLAKALAVPHVDPARTAALAIDLRTGAVVFERNASLSLVPASNQKLPVAYAALALLGPGYRFHTEVVGSGTLVGDVWHGDLWLRGFGDPTLEPSDLDALAAEVASWGIRRVDGAVIADESWFDARRTAPGWRPSFYLYESPPLSALAVDRGWYRGRTSASPALAAGSLLRQSLEAAGVKVRGRTHGGVLTTSGLPLARDVSEPLADVVRFMGRESDNYTAELLVKQLGASYTGVGSTAAGTPCDPRRARRGGRAARRRPARRRLGALGPRPADRGGGRRAARGRTRRRAISATPSSSRSRSPASAGRSRAGCEASRARSGDREDRARRGRHRRCRDSCATATSSRSSRTAARSRRTGRGWRRTASPRRWRRPASDAGGVPAARRWRRWQAHP